MEISEKDLKILVEDAVEALLTKENKSSEQVVAKRQTSIISEEEVADITAIDLQKRLLVPDPVNKEAYLAMKAKTPARLGVWRSGPRMKTETLLRFWADHAASQDAVQGEVSEDLVKNLDLLPIQTKCRDKAEYLTRTDLGREFEEEELEKIRKSCEKNPQVQLIIADGLSSTSIERNVEDILPAIRLGLEAEGIKTGKAIFVKYGRVPSMDVISEVTGAEVCCLLVGERPGLVTGESMSAYMAYKATIGMPESNRTVISNIYNGGTPTVEAGAHIATILKEMLNKKASGVDLKL
ncbi:ethanolamine ammonia-lyase small subunit [Enterococcus sp. PF1-24]|uniref:ethanolamine ammonia-lyase subunit EutC n=1 Tax=unclassified Enterococcus TaxID=2608891 RepID=UPI0024742786|nr:MULTISPECIES: ethanolamine ammonia-lyase subunit EutC [unclassified Enterococcus]MDH6364920.1 ethanolamine ammonia-lyase small subunit [Enterococcus sp. PFB1-1]MDH6402021.1 ethanolamine ammonia-lyase small subunit [Enterococcus sp. PF1-24]